MTKPLIRFLGDWWFVLENLAKGNIEECAKHVAWMLDTTKGYAIKIVNPGGLESWGFGHNVHSIDDQVPNFCITPREIMRGLAKVNAMLNLPHTIHLHTNNLGLPGNYTTTLETMKALEKAYHTTANQLRTLLTCSSPVSQATAGHTSSQHQKKFQITSTPTTT